jgi:hypothetical protein
MKQKQKQIYIYICKTKLRLCCKISSFSQHINFEIYYLSILVSETRNKKQAIGSRTSAFMFCSAISHNSIISFVDTDNKAILHIII